MDGRGDIKWRKIQGCIIKQLIQIKGLLFVQNYHKTMFSLVKINILYLQSLMYERQTRDRGGYMGSDPPV